MSGADALAALNLPSKARKCVDSHRACIERAEDRCTVDVWLDRAESLIDGLKASGAFNDSTIEALYVNFDKAAMARLAELKP
ncbi:hypothetical protein [Pseudomonas rhodesiae]|uniref:hypothetical protein n=1 Tax=Pseudomonas rhodesiae TaxID=76760 RepID=UPI00209DAE62|nr:hypothetical protein [Pseudomonas rhodesiae]MCP1515654.1 hypothetical protein [Pseudomonas rhodesiae]MDF9772900.1 hypothetical protein [Pseudomonas rhodesiae]